MANPTSQKASVAPISFVLDDGNDHSTAQVTLAIRPEDLTRSQPNRVAVVQTLEGGFVDNFGKGLPTISISGHTGWNRYTQDGADGYDRFQQLYDTVITQWYAKRESAVQSGQDPENVKLIFADALNGLTDIVVPMNFVLRRNKARPLLAQYQISMMGTLQYVSAPIPDPIQNLNTSTDTLNDAGLASLGNSISTMQDFANGIASTLTGSLVAPLQGFMSSALGVMTKLQSVMGSTLRAISTVTTPLLNLAGSMAAAGQKLFAGLNALYSFPSAVRASFMQVASAFSNVFCLLQNAFRNVFHIPDYSSIFGASNCSSVSGGSPPSPLFGSNVWQALYPGTGSSINVTGTAAASLSALGGSDPVLAPLTSSQLTSAASNVAAGVSIK